MRFRDRQLKTPKYTDFLIYSSSMKNLFLIIICFDGLFLSCKKSVSKAGLEGTWTCKNRENDFQFIFKNDSVYWAGDFFYFQKGIYQVIDNQLQIVSEKNDTFQFPINRFTENINQFDKDS